MHADRKSPERRLRQDLTTKDAKDSKENQRKTRRYGIDREKTREKHGDTEYTEKNL
jgi:hypothetical protein